MPWGPVTEFRDGDERIGSSLAGSSSQWRAPQGPLLGSGLPLLLALPRWWPIHRRDGRIRSLSEAGRKNEGGACRWFRICASGNGALAWCLAFGRSPTHQPRPGDRRRKGHLLDGGGQPGRLFGKWNRDQVQNAISGNRRTLEARCVMAELDRRNFLTGSSPGAARSGSATTLPANPGTRTSR